MKIYILLVVVGLAYQIEGHGRLLEPPSRASAWRFGYGTPVNYNDNELYCGGLGNQMKQDYKCGVCGDPWQGPRRHEAGGKYATGTIVRHIDQPGSDIEVFVQMTTNHLGWHEFRLCPNNDVNKPVTHACLDRYLLERADGGGTRYYVKNLAERNITLTLRLPKGLTCSQCLLQWKWHTGNRWGIDPDTGLGCRGCGKYQEQFYGCSDISIGQKPSRATTSKPATTRRPVPTRPATTRRPVPTRPATTRRPVPTWSRPATTRRPVPTRPATTHRPVPTRPATTRRPRTTRRPIRTTPSSGRKCVPIGKWRFQPGMVDWCQKNCQNGPCPRDICSCS